MRLINTVSTNPQPLVSIITPAYNSCKYISATIDSVLAQTCTNWELIIVDDCSTDNTVQIINEYIKKDKRIILIKNETNCGQSKSRNLALNQVKGRFIAFLDSDDIWHSNKLEKQINFSLDNSKSFVFSYYEEIDEDGKRLNRQIKAPLEVSYSELLHANYIGCLTVLYDTWAIGKVKIPNVKKRDDWACWLNILKQGYTAYCLPESLAYYRIRKSSISSNKFKVLKYNWNILRKNQNLSLITSSYYFINFLFNKSLKYIQ